MVISGPTNDLKIEGNLVGGCDKAQCHGPRVADPAYVCFVGSDSEFGGVVAQKVEFGEQVQPIGWPCLVNRVVFNVHRPIRPGCAWPSRGGQGSVSRISYCPRRVLCNNRMRGGK